MNTRPFRAFVCLTLLLAAATAAAQRSPAAELRFSATEGRIHNAFFREGPVAAHIVLTSGPAPRLVVAFPAGNSGAALWFDSTRGGIEWRPDVSVEPERRESGDDVLYGVKADITVSGAPVSIRHVIASSVRVIRDYGYTGETPPEVIAQPKLSERAVVWQRRRLDGAPGYYLSIELRDGKVAAGESGRIELVPDTGDVLHLRLTALTGDEPLVPIAASELLTGAARPDDALRRKLAFLSYEGKLLAGSWRFNTYFGRDTLMSLELLMPVLQSDPVEAGLGAVLERLNDQGEVAHEEDIGEYAVLRHLEEDGRASATPIYDYKMIDDDFLLPIVAAHYLLETPAGRERGAQFLARTTSRGETYAAALVRNFRFVLTAASAFADEPDWRNLIALKAEQPVGNWRDSEVGLGGGRFPYDVNGVFVPAALAAIDRFQDAGVLQDILDPQTEAAFSRAGSMAEIWRRRAPGYFEVEVSADVARAEVAEYSARVGVRASPALEALEDEPVTFHAVALDALGAPVPVLNSDEGFALLFSDLAPQEAERIVAALTRPFPAGLMTDVGPVVANPAYATDALEPSFGRSRYHGTVIWSWQQAMLAAGIARQLARDDLGAAARDALARGLAGLERAMARSQSVRGSELWSWSQAEGRYRVEPFGQRAEDETESNAAQLWSTVHLVPLPALSRRSVERAAGARPPMHECPPDPGPLESRIHEDGANLVSEEHLSGGARGRGGIHLHQ